MFAFTMRRLFFAVPTLLVISFVIFALLDLAPNDPTGDLPLTIPPEVREQIRASLGLNEPFFLRYLYWLQQFFINEPLNLIEKMTGWQFGDGQRMRVLSWATRSPVVDPAAITDEMVQALKASGKTVYVALHANHVRELTDAARAAVARIIDAGIPMLSQTVLLKGVNDDPEALGALMRGFVENRIRPYYLHHGDHAPGTAHLRTTVEEGRALMRAIRGRFSGLCQPTYVLDIPDGHGKVPIGPDYLAVDGEVEDPNGGAHAYPPVTPT